MSVVISVLESLGGAPGQGLGPGGAFLGGPPALGGEDSFTESPPSSEEDEPFFNPREYLAQQALDGLHGFMTGGSSVGSNAARTAAGTPVMVALFLLFHLERGFRSPLL